MYKVILYKIFYKPHLQTLKNLNFLETIQIKLMNTGLVLELITMLQ